MEHTIYEISQINQYLKDRFEEDPVLSGIYVRGEISNYKVYPSGHHYFSLKDANASLRCVMFRYSASKLRFRPENGMKVIVAGSVRVFPRDGAYQLYCELLSPEGAGDLHVAFEQLKAKLYAEGLFDAARKKTLPVYPHRIAIITSSAGAAIHDMLRILGKRYPLSKVAILPVRVQGAEAPPEIVGAIRYVNRYQIADLIITGRGGGSAEDLWAFNDERVARAISDSVIPVISAVGHEPDVTISDFVADLRAATPSNAAELAVPDQMDLREKLDSLENRMVSLIRQQLDRDRNQLDYLRHSRALENPYSYYEDRRLLMDHLSSRLISAAQHTIDRAKQDYIRLCSKLDAMSPLKVLSRGYCIAESEKGTPVSAVSSVAEGDSLSLRFLDGTASVHVTEVQKGEQNGTV